MPRSPVTVSAADRLGLTLFFALAVHAIVILGLTFNAQDDLRQHTAPPMEITLVHSRSDEAPDKADYLAQANQQGGGNVDEKVRPSAPVSSPTPSEHKGMAPTPKRAAPPPPQPKRAPHKEVLTAPKAKEKTPTEKPRKPQPARKLPTASQLLQRSQEIARLTAQIRESEQTYAQRPRRTYISGANAKEYRFATYMESWRNKVERIGNLNYPEDARRRGLSGSLLLDVAIRPDGSVVSAKVLRSSGNALLDDAAVRIVHLAGPFAPLPPEIRRDTDELHIIRTWQFESGGSLSTHQ